MLEALVQGGALRQEIDGKNVLKLFIDMYQKQTFTDSKTQFDSEP